MTSLTIPEVDNHLDETGVLQTTKEERESECPDAIDKVVMEDAKDRRRNMQCSWIDIRKAYDSVDHPVLTKILTMHKFPSQLV